MSSYIRMNLQRKRLKKLLNIQKQIPVLIS